MNVIINSSLTECFKSSADGDCLQAHSQQAEQQESKNIGEYARVWDLIFDFVSLQMRNEEYSVLSFFSTQSG